MSPYDKKYIAEPAAKCHSISAFLTKLFYQRICESFQTNLITFIYIILFDFKKAGILPEMVLIIFCLT